MKVMPVADYQPTVNKYISFFVETHSRRMLSTPTVLPFYLNSFNVAIAINFFFRAAHKTVVIHSHFA